jgi:hypothetical protein
MKGNEIIYTNNLVDIVYIPLEGGGFTKQFYIVEKNTTNINAYFINGFKSVREFSDSILKLNDAMQYYKHDKDYFKTLNKSLEVYNSIKTNWADTKFINKTAVKN